MAYRRLLMYSNPMQYGDDVAEVQARLNSLKYNAGVADGWFGQNTRSAVIVIVNKNSSKMGLKIPHFR